MSGVDDHYAWPGYAPKKNKKKQFQAVLLPTIEDYNTVVCPKCGVFKKDWCVAYVELWTLRNYPVTKINEDGAWAQHVFNARRGRACSLVKKDRGRRPKPGQGQIMETPTKSRLRPLLQWSPVSTATQEKEEAPTLPVVIPATSPLPAVVAPLADDDAGDVVIVDKAPPKETEAPKVKPQEPAKQAEAQAPKSQESQPQKEEELTPKVKGPIQSAYDAANSCFTELNAFLLGVYGELVEAERKREDAKKTLAVLDDEIRVRMAKRKTLYDAIEKHEEIVKRARHNYMTVGTGMYSIRAGLGGLGDLGVGCKGKGKGQDPAG